MMKKWVCYEILGQKLAAGPFDADPACHYDMEVDMQAFDIKGYEGVKGVWISEDPPPEYKRLNQ